MSVQIPVLLSLLAGLLLLDAAGVLGTAESHRRKWSLARITGAANLQGGRPWQDWHSGNCSFCGNRPDKRRPFAAVMNP